MVKTRFRHIKGRKVQYLDQYGYWKSTGCDTLAEAKVWYERNIEKSVNGNFGNFAKDMFTDRSIGSYWWIRQKTNRGASEKWWYVQNNTFTNYILPVFKDMEIKDITPSMIQEWYFSLKGKKKPLSDSTRNHYIKCLNLVFNWAKVKGIINTNPVDGVIKIIESNRKRDRFTDEELAIMFPESIESAVEIWGSLRFATFIYIMRDTGWRQGEITGLDVSGFVQECNGIFTRQSFDSFSHKIKDSIKTTGKGYDFKVGLLSDFTSKLLSFFIESMHIECGLIFEGKPMMTSLNIGRHYKRCMKKLGISTENRPPYAIRTTFMTKMAKSYDEETVMELMGHTHWHSCYDQRTPKELLEKIRSHAK